MYSEEVRKYVDEIVEKYNEISANIQNVFNDDFKEIVRFEYSQRLAISCGVPKNETLTTPKDIDDYFNK